MGKLPGRDDRWAPLKRSVVSDALERDHGLKEVVFISYQELDEATFKANAPAEEQPRSSGDGSLDDDEMADDGSEDDDDSGEGCETGALSRPDAFGKLSDTLNDLEQAAKKWWGLNHRRQIKPLDPEPSWTRILRRI